MIIRKTIALGALALGLSTLVACGGAPIDVKDATNAGEGESAGGGEETAGGEGETEGGTEGGDKNLVEVAEAAGSFKSLITAVSAAGLVETIQEKELTIFAPTDEAFDEIAEVAKKLIEAEDKTDLKKVLTLHVVEGKVMASDVKPGTVTTLGGDIELKVEGDKVMLVVGGITANVVKTDVTASNGVIHVIDKVLVPSDMQ